MTADGVGDVLILAWGLILGLVGFVLLAGCFSGDQK